MRVAMYVKRARVALVALAIAGAFACASPTLPLPPPQIPIVSASTTAGYVHLASRNGAEPNAIIIIVNQNPALANDRRVSGTQADANGTWDAEVPAATGDVLAVSETVGTDTSPSISVQVK
jgi:hypothetical protein